MTEFSLYGKGIFTTIRIVEREPFLWQKHWRRLADNASKIGIDLAEHTERSTRDALDQEVSKNDIVDGRARITFFDDSPSEIWTTNIREVRTTLSIIVGERRDMPHPFKLTISPYPINSSSPLAGVKSCNYLENILALDETRARGFHEAVRLNEKGHITSGVMSNVFWLKGKQLYTPMHATGCLAGTTREYVLENVECEEVEAAVDELRRADAIFLTSAGLGVVQVSELDGQGIAKSTHPITRLL